MGAVEVLVLAVGIQQCHWHPSLHFDRHGIGLGVEAMQEDVRRVTLDLRGDRTKEYHVYQDGIAQALGRRIPVASVMIH